MLNDPIGYLPTKLGGAYALLFQRMPAALPAL